ncbi:MAG: hypothetical protein JW937_06740 [Candidatus Omnitrophica bacterium]|nr:hypothetical protein [Candidatus Omnitrophota bacterium]
MKNLMVIALLASALMLTGTAYANVTYEVGVETAFDASGDPIIDGTYAMVLDRDNDGWNGNSYLTQSPGDANGFSWLWDSDDYLMDYGQVGDIGFPLPGFATPNAAYTTGADAAAGGFPAGYDAGVDQYYLLWFDKPFDVASAGPGGNVDYGAELLGFAGQDPGTYTPTFIGGNAYLTTVVPEPISAALALIGAGAMITRRRWKHVRV